jgi:hypothetical protein
MVSRTSVENVRDWGALAGSVTVSFRPDKMDDVFAMVSICLMKCLREVFLLAAYLSC